LCCIAVVRTTAVDAADVAMRYVTQAEGCHCPPLPPPKKLPVVIEHISP